MTLRWPVLEAGERFFFCVSTGVSRRFFDKENMRDSNHGGFRWYRWLFFLNDVSFVFFQTKKLVEVELFFTSRIDPI